MPQPKKYRPGWTKGRLTLIARVGYTATGAATAVFRCECGSETVMQIGNVVNGHSSRCDQCLPGLWDRVVKTDSCWVWSGALNNGYGVMLFEGRIQLTHRIAWQIAHGPIPDGMHVLHRCDNRPCCNPDHLFLGTNDDNIADAVAKGRHRYPRNYPASRCV